MKTETVKQAIDFVLGTPVVQGHIDSLEAHPNRFVIHHITAEVRNIQTSTIRVFINFYEAGNPNLYKEDVIVDLKGTTYSDFQILGIFPTQV